MGRKVVITSFLDEEVNPAAARIGVKINPAAVQAMLGQKDLWQACKAFRVRTTVSSAGYVPNLAVGGLFSQGTFAPERLRELAGLKGQLAKVFDLFVQNTPRSFLLGGMDFEVASEPQEPKVWLFGKPCSAGKASQEWGLPRAIVNVLEINEKFGLHGFTAMAFDARGIVPTCNIYQFEDTPWLRDAESRQKYLAAHGLRASEAYARLRIDVIGAYQTLAMSDREADQRLVRVCLGHPTSLELPVGPDFDVMRKFHQGGGRGIDGITFGPGIADYLKGENSVGMFELLMGHLFRSNTAGAVSSFLKLQARNFWKRMRK